MKNMNFEIKDKCLLWGMPELAFLAVSLLAAIKVGSDFRNDWLAESVTFLGCNATLWLLYVLFQSTLLDVCPLLPLFGNKAVGSDAVATECDDTAKDKATTDLQPSEDDGLPFVTQTAEQYQQRNRQFQQEREARKRELVSAIMEYVNYVMPPFVRNEDMAKLCNEILMWTQNPNHKPCSVALKFKVSTLDLRHFVWNIGERLGKDNGYDGSCRAVFVKRMFPDVFADMEIDSIRNLRVDPDKGHIKIDVPEQGDFAFHYSNPK